MPMILRLEFPAPASFSVDWSGSRDYCGATIQFLGPIRLTTGDEPFGWNDWRRLEEAAVLAGQTRASQTLESDYL